MENHNAVPLTPPVNATDIPIAGGVAGACSEERKAQLEAMMKAALPLNSRVLLIAILPTFAAYIVTEALAKAIEVLNPKNWPIFKDRKFND